jgi:hypothetical protein
MAKGDPVEQVTDPLANVDGRNLFHL